MDIENPTEESLSIEWITIDYDQVGNKLFLQLEILPVNEAIDSVINQIYGNWEICISDDASDCGEIKKTIIEYSKKDNRIKYSFIYAINPICFFQIS